MTFGNSEPNIVTNNTVNVKRVAHNDNNSGKRDRQIWRLSICDTTKPPFDSREKECPWISMNNQNNRWNPILLPSLPLLPSAAKHGHVSRDQREAWMKVYLDVIACVSDRFTRISDYPSHRRKHICPAIRKVRASIFIGRPHLEMEIGFRAKTVIMLLWGSKNVVLNSTNIYSHFTFPQTIIRLFNPYKFN